MKQKHHDVLGDFIRRSAKPIANPVPKIVNNPAFRDKTSGEALEIYFKDEVQLLNKLLEICRKEKTEIELRRPASLASSDSSIAGFDYPETLDRFIEKGSISLFPNTANKTVSKSQRLYKVIVHLTQLKIHAQEVHDTTETYTNVVLGMPTQKEKLLQLINQEFAKQEMSEKIIVTEKILGRYIPENLSFPLGISLSQPDKNRPDIQYQFITTIKALAEEGHFVIENIGIDLNAKPQLIENTDSKYPQFYPPEHCKVTLRKTESVSSLHGQTQIITWNGSFQWSANGINFELGGNQRVTFLGGKNIRRDIFKQLTLHKGVWVKVRDIAKEINRSEKYVRIVIAQICVRIKNNPELRVRIQIEAQKINNIPGAFRINSL